MHTFKYNDQGDWVLNEMVYGTDQVIQNLKHLFRQRVTEWLFNENQGFRHEDLWEKHIDRKRIIQAVYDCAYQEPRVLEVKEVDYTYDKIRRHLSVTFSARIAENDEWAGVNLDVNVEGI
ncbi:hypothetical protein [Solibacillus isronensis]|uniref:hypothetical protein n=1 Tax=Solibacillus isronensis TaxID=412383 RepID=UPI00399F6B06